MPDLTNKAIVLIILIAIAISVISIISTNNKITGLATGNVSVNLSEEISILVTGTIDFGSGRVYSNASFAIVDSSTPLNYSWENLTIEEPPFLFSYPYMAYDSNRNRIVLWGAYNGTDLLNDTYEFNGSSLIKRTDVTTYPSPWRFGGRMVYDENRGVMVLYGGVDYNNWNISYNETWEYDGNTWINKTGNITGAPSVGGILGSFGMVYDSKRGVVVLFGGSCGFGCVSSETWEYNGTNWVNRTDISPDPTYGYPGGREDHGMVFDSTRNVTVIFGTSWPLLSNLNDTWEYNGTAWHFVCAYCVPDAGIGTGAAYDSNTKRIIAYFGASGSDNETWEYDPTLNESERWRNITGELSLNPGRKENAGFVYMPSISKFVLFGGKDDSNGSDVPENETWEFVVAVPGSINGTWKFGPQYFYIENDGTVNETINVSADKTASTFIGGTSPQFQIKGIATETGACAGTLSTSYFELSTTQQTICSLLQFGQSADQFKASIKLKIPSDAPVGTKTATITFSASLSQ